MLHILHVTTNSYSYDIKMILKMVIKTFHVAVRAGPDMYGVNYVKLHNSIYNLHLTVKMRLPINASFSIV